MEYKHGEGFCFFCFLCLSPDIVLPGGAKWLFVLFNNPTPTINREGADTLSA